MKSDWRLTLLAFEGLAAAAVVYVVAATRNRWTLCLVFATYAALMMVLARWVQKKDPP